MSRISGFPPPPPGRTVIPGHLFPRRTLKPDISTIQLNIINRWLGEEGENLSKDPSLTREALLQIINGLLQELFGSDTGITFRFYEDKLTPLQNLAKTTQRAIYIRKAHDPLIFVSPQLSEPSSRVEVLEITAAQIRLKVGRLPDRTGCIVVVPIISGLAENAVIHGVMTLSRTRPNQFNAHDVILLAMIAEDIGLALADVANSLIP